MNTKGYNFAPFKEKMGRENLPEIVIDIFEYYYTSLVEKGDTSGLISESSILPVTSLPDAEQLGASYAEFGKTMLPKTVMIKLNGGLGTSMGLNKAKSLLKLKNNLSFLEIIINQAITDNVPLVLMNSFRTQGDSLEIMKKYPNLRRDLPPDFLQHKIPKILKSELIPAKYDASPEMEWCPPGHGDIYAAMITSGILNKMLSAGYEYAFVSNADNLGAVLDESILGYFARNRLPFMMEAADRTEADKKGGHLASSPSGQLLLREIAQCPQKDLPDFQDIMKHKYFNTNNIWLNLKTLQETLSRQKNNLCLPMICNTKTLDPREEHSPQIYQLETAMGSAISVFAGSKALRVPRTRFLPVKKTSDLLAVRSDLFSMTNNFRIIQNPNRKYDNINIELDLRYYKLIDEMEKRFPESIPSLINCKNFKILGDVKFGKNITLNGNVVIENNSDKQKIISDNSIIEK